MIPSNLLISSVSSPGGYGAIFEGTPRDETSLKVAQTSETILRKRGRETEEPFQKRRKQTDLEDLSEKEFSKAEIDEDLFIDLENFSWDFDLVDFFQDEQEAPEKKELGPSAMVEENFFDPEEFISLEQYFTFQNQNLNSDKAEQSTDPNSSIYPQHYEKKAIISQISVILRTFPTSSVHISPKNIWTILYSNGDKYIGEVDKKTPCGEGTFFFSDGGEYKGSFVNGRVEGHGIFSCANGGCYKGTFVNGILHGYGEVVSQDRTRYVGNLSKGMPCGKGSLYQTDGTIIESDLWESSLKPKSGKIIYPNQAIYEGEIVDRIPHGKGTLFFSTGGYCKGFFINGMLDGYGEALLQKQSRYLGNFTKGFPSGVGLLHLTDGTIIKSKTWDCHLQLKEGKATYLDKTIYKGSFFNLRPHGKGTLLFSTGERYIGIFTNGQLNGKAKIIWPDKSRYETVFINGKSSGKGSLFLTDGTLIESDTWNDTIRSGLGKIIYPRKKKIYEGPFINLQPHGVGKWTGSIKLRKKLPWRYEGNFIDGKPSGKGTLFLADGNIVESDTWTDELWCESGKIIYPNKAIYEGSFVKLEFVSREQLIYANGRQYISCRLESVNREHSASLNENPYTGIFWNRRLQGVGKITLQDERRYEGNLIYGVPSGEGSLFLADGTVIKSDIWTFNLQTRFGKIVYPDGRIYEGSLLNLQPDRTG